MVPFYIVIITFSVISFLWIIMIRRKLVILDENINNAMNQIGIHLVDCYDALMTILDLTKNYTHCESEELLETIVLKKRVIAAKSTPNIVQGQEKIISQILNSIALLAEQYPEMNADQFYIETMNSVQEYKNKIRTSRLIYNDYVSKLNRQIRKFPISMIAGLLGFRQREHLVEEEG